ncbi:COA8 family protein CBG23705, mitochondrial-like [Diadema setosum]|uniref:COA8 family protein CBG23705, mitochondrial-like n=1 Tax=Diadema setosum TaxID=31175 RepID=UPI003B3BDC99
MIDMNIIPRLLIVARLHQAGHFCTPYVISRQFNTKSSKCNFPEKASSPEEDPKDDQPPLAAPPPFPERDWIGPADKRSNLRRVILRQPENESKAERMYREQREDTNEWNHQFWSQQNEKFIKAKEKFVKSRLEEKKREAEISTENSEVLSDVKQVLSAEEMAKFYQEFLKDNRKVFQDYNKQWYYRNFSLLIPAIKANLHRLLRKNKR